METIHVQFDEMSEPMAPVKLSTGPAPTFLTPGQIISGLVPNPVPAAPYVPPTNKELEILFQPMVVVPGAKIPYWESNSQNKFDPTTPHFNDPSFSKVNTFRSGEDTKVKTVNDVRQIQALIDKNKLIITETSIRSDLHLEDAGGTDCLSSTTIFEELARMGAKSTTWNEFSSTMASLIICLATNQKFNLSKYIFDAMVKHLDGGVKFLMYPQFLQVFINQQLGYMSHHKKIYVNPSHTKKIFANMKREGKDFSGRITPLFDTMMVQASEEVGEDSDHPTDSNQIPIVDQPSTSSPPKKKQKSKRKQRKEAKVAHDETEHEESVPTPSNDLLPSGEDSMQLNDLMVLCTKLQKQDTRRCATITLLLLLPAFSAFQETYFSFQASQPPDHWNEMCYQLLKLMIQKMNIKFRGGLLGLKRLQGFLLLLSTVSIELLLSVEVKTAQICAAGYKDTTAAELQLLEDLLLSRG
ncbi:hypothetical protein Tco_0115554 [Tanacetum coccineum]